MNAPIAGSASSALPNTALLAGQTTPDPSGGMADTIGQIRQIAQSVDALGSSNPAFADGVTQIKTILRQMIISAAQQASQQTASGQAVPGGAMG